MAKIDCSMHSEVEALEHMKKRDTCHQSVSLENKTGDSTVLKIGDSAKVGRMHKYGFNNNKRKKPEKVRVVDDETGDKHQLDEVLRMPSTCIMGSPPAFPPPSPPSPPPSPPPPAPSDASGSPSTVKPTRKASLVHVDPATGKANGPHRKKLRTYLGIVARDNVDVTYENWNEVPTAQKDLIWEDIQRNLISQKLLTVGRKGSYFRPLGRDGGSLNQTSRGNGPLQLIKMMSRTLSVRNTASAKKSGPNFARLAETLLGRMCARRHKPSRSRILSPTFSLVGKLLVEKTKKKLQEAAQSGSVDGVIDPPSPVRRHVKWKMARTKKTGEITTEAAKEITEKIQTTQGSFVPHGCQDVLIAAIGRPEHPGRVRAAVADVTIKQYFGSAPRMPRSSSSLPPEELQQLTQQIRDQLEESITERVTRQPDAVSASVADAISRTSTIVHNTPLLPDKVKVSVKEVTDADAPVPVPTDKVSLVGRHFTPSLLGRHIWSTGSPAKPPPKPDPEVRWDATVFGVFNPNFPRYIKHEDLSEIAHGGQCLSISVLQLWILRHWQMVVILPKEHLVVWFCSLHNRPDNYLKGIINSLNQRLLLGGLSSRQKGSTECGYYVMH
ncbi:hypothetical protein HKD37_15G044202 [Glycine soja]